MGKGVEPPKPPLGMPLMKRKVRSMNLRLDRALLGCASPTFVVLQLRSSLTHGLHPNSRGKERVRLLIAERSSDKNLSATISIPDRARASLFF